MLHYIVDKSWAARVRGDGSAGYRGQDGVTHGWWWVEWERWLAERWGQGEREPLSVVGEFVASADGEGSEEMQAIGGGAQAFAKKWEGGDDAAAGEKRDDGTYGQGPHGPVLRKRVGMGRL